jgi:hypothetical protein
MLHFQELVVLLEFDVTVMAYLFILFHTSYYFVKSYIADAAHLWACTLWFCLFVSELLCQLWCIVVYVGPCILVMLV